MNRILYISPYMEDTPASNGGYGVIAESFKRMFDLFEDTKIDYIHISNLNQQILDYKFSNYDLCIVLVHPSSFNAPIFKKNIEHIFTFCNKKYLHVFWETYPLPQKWKWLWSSSLFNGFICPSMFILNMINEETKKFNKQNYLIYNPVFKEDFEDYKIQTEEKENEEFFNVLYIGQYTKRKGMEDAIVSFVNALSEFNDCRLFLKYHKLSDIEIDTNSLIDSLVNTNTKKMNAQIFEITDNLDKDKIYSLYNSSSLLLFPSRGEGFGLPCIEAGMVGLPIIYTNWSATVETAKFKGNTSIDCHLDTAYGMANYDYETNSLYAIPSIKSLIKGLKYYYSGWKKDKKAYYNIVSNNYIDIEKKFSKDFFISQFKKLL
jgi:glycosyltransferase involved in cell wall biosynthesis